MKKFFSILTFIFAAAFIFAQDFSDENLFGSSDDDFFSDDGIEELVPEAGSEENAVKSDLKKGVLFETGSIKVGGKFSTSIGTSTVIYKDDSKSFADHLSESTLTPTLSAYLTVDARPTQALRMYTKFGLAYPFTTTATSTAQTAKINFTNPLTGDETEMYSTSVNTSIKDWFKLKELFTDFSIADTAFFRFGLHTVTWGTGYFFSPVSDMINTSSINPEDVTAQVDGCLNLRTQICFPDTQNCLWFYVIPSTDFTSDYSTATYAKYTALAGKADLVFGGWEFGLGGFWKWQSAPKGMLTASGSVKNINLFGEAVYSYGADTEWSENPAYKDKTSIFQATAGCSYYWKNPSITVAAQYYYDGNNKDLVHQYFTYGHNIAGVASFGRIAGKSDLSANVFAMMNFGKEEIPDLFMTYLEAYGISSYLNAATFSALVSYNPIDEITVSAGPYVTFTSLENPPVVSLKFELGLGGGKF